MLKDGFLKMNSFLLSKMLKYSASIILKLSLKTFFKWKIHLSNLFFISCYYFNTEIYIGREKVERLLKNMTKFAI